MEFRGCLHGLHRKMGIFRTSTAVNIHQYTYDVIEVGIQRRFVDRDKDGVVE